jgi:predicted ATPase/DNA-binding CsgD family transcriptional regulator
MPNGAEDRTRDTGHAYDGETTVSARAASTALGISERTIRRAIARHELNAVKRAGVHRIAPDDLERYRAIRHIPIAFTTRRHDSRRFIPLPGQPRTPAFNVPRPLTALIVREHELGELRDRLLDEEVQLLTLTGPGGVDKTRLALEGAAALRDAFNGGVWFIDLLPLTDPVQVLGTIARALEVRDTGGRTLTRRLIAFLENRQALLILDNFERVTAAAPSIVALLSACPELTALVTSRTFLHVSGEHLFPISPLQCPIAGPSLTFAEVAGFDAVRLFVMRAQSARPAFELTETNMTTVASICQRLDGLPLAIELAAARAKHLNPSAMLARLDRRLDLLTGGMRDQPSRMQSMRAAVAWSYDLLTPAKQRLFRRLSVFVDGFTLDAAVAACAGDEAGAGNQRSVETPESAPPVSPPSVLDGVISLIDKSLLDRAREPVNEPRFTMLETLREYALAQLEASDEMKLIRTRHATWCLALAESVEAERMGMTSTSIDRLGPDRDNLRAALQWLEDRCEVGIGLRLANALWPLWIDKGEVSEGRAILAALLSLPDSSTDRSVWAHALCVSGALAQAQGDLRPAVSVSQQALAVFDEIGDVRGAAAALNTLGLDAMIQTDYGAAIAFLERSRARFQDVNDPRAGGWALRHLSSVAFRLGNIARGAALAEEGLTIARTAGNRLDTARLLLNLCHAAVLHGDLEGARALGQECLDLFHVAGDRWGVADALQRLGHVAFEQGDIAPAEDLLEASHVLFQEIGDPEGLAIVLVLLGWLHRAKGSNRRAAEYIDEGLAIARQHENPSRMASSLLERGALALDRGDCAAAAAAWKESLSLASTIQDHLAIAAAMEWAAHLTASREYEAGARVLGTASTIRNAHGVPAAASQRIEREQLFADLRAALGCASFDRTFAFGGRLSLDAAIAGALGILDGAISNPPDVPLNPTSTPSQTWLAGLSPREIEGLRLLAEGMSDRDIADSLSISCRTVGGHVAHLLAKLGVESRTAAVAHALRRGLS